MGIPILPLARLFSELWESESSVPNVFSFLKGHPEASSSDQVDVLRIDQTRRARLGISVPVEEYFAQILDVARDRASRLDLIEHEFRVREEQGLRPDLDAYGVRFPELSEDLFERLPSRSAAGDDAPAHSAGETDEIELNPNSADWAGAIGNYVAPTDSPEYIGRYRVERVLGDGGFGRVYLANDDRLDRLVGVKVPHPHLVSEPEDVASYLAEAKVLAGLDHPGIVEVYDFGETDDGLCYLVEKYIPGSNLAERLKAGRPSHTETAKLVASVAEALHVVHKHKLVHRDIKPANIIVDNTGRPFVIDFGLALGEKDFGKKGHRGGTIAYMSPEQARHEGHLVDGRSDIFSLGIVLYEMLAGVRPFEGDEPDDVLERIQTHEARPPRQVDDSVPWELERICLKALSKRLTERYNTILDMAEELRQFLEVPAAEPALSVPEAVRAKGLRSFDAEDAGFFLDLLPGPRDRDGLPESIQFWKTRIEETDPDRTFRVGLIYGPSGCGKSSLVKAGILPRLADHVRTVFVEASPSDTEGRLLRGVRKRCPEVSEVADLAETLARVRMGRSGSPEGKLLLVVDQFEQWLHGRSEYGSTDLVLALRQCDGRRVQCVVLVRDDFWMSVTRFAQELDVRLEEARNSTAVDLFDLRHAQKVLTGFGRAFEALPPLPQELTKSQSSFVSKAVSGIATEGKVIPVHLALFAEMVKGSAWSSATLREIGGTEGVGVQFLERTFSDRTSPPEHRLHEAASKAVLQALLPEPGTVIKGHMRSRSELIEASGPKYVRGARSFDDLMSILDGQVRLLTPVDPDLIENGDAREPPGEAHYQLTHDYLVPPVREWLTRGQRKTLRGRTRLKLAERAALWRSKPERKQLPSLPEWVGIRLLTGRAERTDTEREMLRAAARQSAVWSAVVVVVLALLSWAGYEAVGRVNAARLYDALVISELPSVPAFVEEEIEPRRRWIDPLLGAGLDEETDDDVRLRLSLALLPEDPTQTEYLIERLLGGGPESVRVVRTVLEPHSTVLAGRFWEELESGVLEDRRFRAACALAAYAPDDPRWADHARYVAALLVRQLPLELESWIAVLAPARRILIPHLRALFAMGRSFERRNAAAALVVYLGDSREELVELLRAADASQFGVVIKGLADDDTVDLLEHELTREPPSGEGIEDADLDTFAQQQANFAAGLLVLGSDAAWAAFAAGPDQRLRTSLIHSLVPYGMGVNLLIDRLRVEKDDSIRRALVLAIGEYDPLSISARLREELVRMLLDWFARDSDPGLHSAVEWLLRHWSYESELAAALRALVVSPPEKDTPWYVTEEGHTMVLLSPPDGFEADPQVHEQYVKMLRGRGRPHVPLTDVPRQFYVSSKEVTLRQFVRFLEAHGAGSKAVEKFTRLALPQGGDLDETGRDRPIKEVKSSQAIEYCVWLSEQEGLDLCYVRREDGTLTFHPDRSGYRLPTFAESEFACRAGTTTRTHFGSEMFASSYAWFQENSDEMTHPVGRLKPNDFGLFDVHGNLRELSKCCYHDECDSMAVRAGGCRYTYYYLGWSTAYPVFDRSDPDAGFRIVRTAPE